MASYRAIQNWVQAHYGFVPNPCWIAHVKELNRLPLRPAPNRQGAARRQLCPAPHRPAIEAAFRHFGMLAPEP